MAECSDGQEAAAEIRETKPDLVFLDVRMPGIDGFDVLRRVKSDPPAVIFVTAHDEYALRAFDVDAVDYLLKPFDRRRFNEALRRARKRIESGRRPSRGTGRPRSRSWPAAGSAVRTGSRFAVRERDRMILIPVSELDWIGAEGKYVRLHAGTTAGAPGHLLRASMAEVERRLDPSEFVRIHRGTIVNLKRIVELYRGFGGNHVVVLGGGRRLTLSRRYRARLRSVGGLT